MSLSLPLIALCLGYLVFVYGSREKEGVRLLGRVIGAVVMIVAFANVVCISMKCASKAGYGKSCSIMAKATCPMHPKTK